LKVVVHEKLDLPEAFHERRMHEFGGEYGRRRGPFFPQKKIEFVIGAEMQFPAVSIGLLSLFSLFLVDILSRSLHTDITNKKPSCR